MLHVTIYVAAVVECDRCHRREKHTLKSSDAYPGAKVWDTKLRLPPNWGAALSYRDPSLPYAEQELFQGDACPECAAILGNEETARYQARQEREAAAKARREAAEHEARLAATAEKGSFRT